VTIVFAGPPCAGKSTIAAAVAARLGLPHLAMDEVRQRILPDAAHTRADRQAAYRAMEFAAELLANTGAGAVLDAPYGHAEDRERAMLLKPVWIECVVSVETAVRRFQHRGPDPVRLDLTDEVVRRMVSEYQYTRAGLLLDTDSLTVDDCVRESLEYIGVR
jgi:predicted kinase